MPYQISSSRNNNAVAILSNTAGLNQHLDGLSALLQINTDLPNDEFLTQFRAFKVQYHIINDLCQPDTGGLFWRKGISYFFKTDTQRAERYKTIVRQLKQGETTGNISYFGDNHQNKNSVCNKIETIKNEYLTKSYPNENNDNFKKDNRTYLELCNFQNNVDYKKPIQVLPATIQNLDSSSKDIFTEFVKINPQYSSITSENESSSNEINVEKIKIIDLKKGLCANLQINNNASSVTIFLDNGNNGTITPAVGEAIKQQQQQQQQQAATKIQNNFRRHIEQRVFHSTTKSFKAITNQINSQLPENQHITVSEIHLIMSTLKLINDTKLPLFLGKSSTNFSHSILIEKSENGYSVLIKPALKNADVHINKQAGTHKYVKTSGVQINLDTTKNFVDAQRIVTVSKSPNKSLKDIQLNNRYGTDLFKDGFTKVAYKDAAENPRIIFKKTYLGENLHSLKRNLSYPEKIEIATQLVNKFNWNIGDIKTGNILWDGAIATFIDTNDMLFTHTTKHDDYQKNRGDFSDNSPKKIAHQQIFSLCCALYELFNTKLNDQLQGHYWDHQPKPQGLFSPKSKRLQLPFANLVNQTYLHSIKPNSALETLKTEIRYLKTVNQPNI